MSKNVVILGGGESGVGAAILAQHQGYSVFVSDKGKLSQEYKTMLQEHNIEFEELNHTYEKILNASIVIKSPGIPNKVDIVQKLKIHEIPIVSEIEFAYQHLPEGSKIIAITGSNGKTTTTMLTHHLLKEAGVNCAIGGNIGDSLALQLTQEPKEWYVVEVSSFQLDDCIDFKPDIAMLTNITPDHLDWYDYKMNLYIDSKFSITKNQTEEDYFIYCKDDEVTTNNINNYDIKSKKIAISLRGEVKEGAYRKENDLIFNTINGFDMNIKELALKGNHNVQNSMAAGMAAHFVGIRKESIRQSLANFESVEHRLEAVTKVQGIEFINDSKATNVNAVYYALESMESPTVWIVGGIDKGNDYNELLPLVSKNVKAIVCLGIDNSKITSFFEDKVPVIVETSNMREAVKTAFVLSKKGDKVLLSPACSSFDLFENYEDRGNQFKQEVKKL